MLVVICNKAGPVGTPEMSSAGRGSKGEKESGGYGGARRYIPQGCDSRTMYGYWPSGSIDSHDEGATDHPETETPAVPNPSPTRLLPPPPPLRLLG